MPNRLTHTHAHTWLWRPTNTEQSNRKLQAQLLSWIFHQSLLHIKFIVHNLAPFSVSTHVSVCIHFIHTVHKHLSILNDDKILGTFIHRRYYIVFYWIMRTCLGSNNVRSNYTNRNLNNDTACNYDTIVVVTLWVYNIFKINLRSI